MQGRPHSKEQANEEESGKPEQNVIVSDLAPMAVVGGRVRTLRAA